MALLYSSTWLLLIVVAVVAAVAFVSVAPLSLSAKNLIVVGVAAQVASATPLIHVHVAVAVPPIASPTIVFAAPWHWIVGDADAATAVPCLRVVCEK